MKLEVLMSTMHQNDFSIAIKSKVNSDLLIINQCNSDETIETVVNGHKWRMISTTERGLSKSRNMALKHAEGDICLWSDDDEIFADGYADQIVNAYKSLPDATAIAFNVKRINFRMKKTYYHIERIRRGPKYRGYQSGMLSFRRKEIIDAGISFDEKFGSGTPWGGGEEILFERDIRKCGYCLYEHPFEVATLDYGGGSQWFKGYNEKYFYNLGAFSYYSNQYRVTGMMVIKTLYVCFYKLRKEKTLSPLEKLSWMIKGMQGIKKDITYDDYQAISTK